MPGQSVIVGVGAIDYPSEYQATDPRALAEIGVGKVITMTSTYDHRVIQGAESGLFLKAVHELLIGEQDFYDEIFDSLRSPTSRCAGTSTTTRGSAPTGRRPPRTSRSPSSVSSASTGSAGTSSRTSTRWPSPSSASTPSSTRRPTA
jgi:hypothetical protein